MFFDRDADYDVMWRRLPHWSQAGTICFITWRTDDSMPSQVLIQWERRRHEILKEYSIDAQQNWQMEFRRLPAKLQAKLGWQFTRAWGEFLDQGHGGCVLRRPELSAIVVDGLRYFDGDRYDLFDAVVMPNHVHFLVAFNSADAMLKQCEGWKRFTARAINRQLGRSGNFWQRESFDHLVRSETQFQYLRRYIADNPRHLPPGAFRWYSKRM